MRIHLYTEPGCSACTEAKSFLQSCGIAFEERNVRHDPEFLRILQDELDSCTLPTLVAGDTLITGFDRGEYQRFRVALRNHNLRSDDIELERKKSAACQPDFPKNSGGSEER
jgi:glutaredoxin